MEEHVKQRLKEIADELLHIVQKPDSYILIYADAKDIDQVDVRIMSNFGNVEDVHTLLETIINRKPDEIEEVWARKN